MASHGPNDAFAAVAVLTSSAVIVGHNLVYAYREERSVSLGRGFLILAAAVVGRVTGFLWPALIVARLIGRDGAAGVPRPLIYAALLAAGTGGLALITWLQRQAEALGRRRLGLPVTRRG